MMLGLVRRFVDWAGIRLIGAMALAMAGAMVEGVGLLMLVPVIGMLLDGGSSAPFGMLAEYLPTGRSGLSAVLALFAILILVRFTILHARNVVLAELEQAFVAEMRLSLFRRLAEAPWRTAARLAHGRIAHALSRNVDRSAQAVGALLRGLSAAILLLVQAGLALWLAPGLTLLVGAFSALMVIGLAPVRRRATRLGQQMTVEDYQLFSTTTGFL
ncbi:MAG: ABC transporter transmembrane domain-containing protein, partial [Paracoccaceae bacterium]